MSQPLHTITVTATGTAKGTPDTIKLPIIVELTTPIASSQEALQTVNSSISQVSELLDIHQIPTNQRQTQHIQLTPQYERHDGHRSLTGYTARQSLTIQAGTDISIETLIDQLSKIPHIQLQGISYELQESSHLADTARANAYAQALHQAQQLAQLAGHTLGAAQTIIEGAPMTPPTPYYGGEMRMMAASDSSTHIEAGQLDIRCTLTMTFLIKENQG